MLPPFIIEQIRRREEEERKRHERPPLELPVSPAERPLPNRREDRDDSDQDQHDVVIVEL